jgi:hypothetical protein
MAADTSTSGRTQERVHVQPRKSRTRDDEQVSDPRPSAVVDEWRWSAGLDARKALAYKL